jgi:S-adenosylmethionine:tRNA ribosyltransferase-isomerase
VGRDVYWQCFAKPAKKLKLGDSIVFSEDFCATVVEKLESGEVVLQFEAEEQFYPKLERYGQMPLPPYIERQRETVIASEAKQSNDRSPRLFETRDDNKSYQTLYAKHDGSVAAPTAGLHFTDDLLKRIDAAGMQRVHITLHVGGGTFLPVKVEDTKDHVMHSEYAIVTQEAAKAINAAKAKGGRIIAVGTTSMRTLESASDENGVLHPFSAETNIFITPGYRFRMVDKLMTNFHLPRSTLFMLVSAFAGLETMKNAYNHSITKGYRFYSYGDTSLLSRQK